MSRNYTIIESVSTGTWTAGAGATCANVFGPYNISNFKDFSVTVQTCASHGVGFGIFTAPINETLLFVCATGNVTTITSGIKTPVTLNMVDNNQHWLVVKASATAGYSASNTALRVILNSIERDM